jgi:hypothetical protein
VTILEPAAGPANVRRVAAGGAEFCLTSVAHYLRATAEEGAPAARFVAVVGQQSPMAGLVAADSPVTAPEALGGRRVAGPVDGRLIAEYRAGLAELGVAEPDVVERSYADAPAAVGHGEAEAVADFADLTPRVRRQAGVDIRPVRVGPAVYSSGLVAGAAVADELVARMRAAAVAALERQRAAPETGVAALCAHYPGTDPGDAIEGWRLAEPAIFTDAPVGAMEPDRWRASIAHYAAAHGLPAPGPESVSRPVREGAPP